MERQDVKAWLKRYIVLKHERAQLEYMIKQLKIDYDGIKAQALTGMPSGSKKAVSVQESALLKICDMESIWTAKCNAMYDTMHMIESVIEKIEDFQQREVLRYRYIGGLRWEEIAYRMSYEWTWTHELHKRGLDAVGKILDDSDKCE